MNLPKKSRQYDIDWIRIILIVSVFFYHIGMIFNGLNWHVKNEERIMWLDPVMGYLHAWRMPLLFLVSGVGTRFVLSRRNISEYVKERFSRLMVPFFSGLIFLIPIQGYFRYNDTYDTLGEYYVRFFERLLHFDGISFQHLWFILYLFLISMFFIPFVWFYRSSAYVKFERKLEQICDFPGGCLLFVVPILLTQYLLLPFFPQETLILYNDWAYFSLNMIYFVYGFILIGNPRIVRSLVRYRYLYGMLVILSSLEHFYPDNLLSHRMDLLISYANEYTMSWVICLTILGFARKLLNHDHPLRKPLNQSIYPFYLLQQPVIIMVGYYVVRFSWNPGWKALFLIVVCLSLIVIIYTVLILPFNPARVAFGLRKKQPGTNASEVSLIHPAFEFVRRNRNLSAEG